MLSLSRFGDFDQTLGLMNELRRQMNRVWDEVEPDAGFGASVDSVWPRINLYDGGSTLVLKADVPGLSEKDIHVTLSEGGLSLSGERKVVAPEGYSAHRQERSSVKFSRSIALPCRVSADQTTASVKNGVLTVTLAKTPDAQPRQITVQAQ